MEKLEIGRLLRKAQVLSDDILDMEAIEVDRAYERVKRKVRGQQRKRMREQMMKVAAGLALPLAISSMALGYLYWKELEPVTQYAEVTAAAGSVIRYELPDRSVVWLNAGTTLRYPTVFQPDRREVDLKGEAYFEVEADPKHPFYVKTAQGPTVYVYGTKFNVSAYEEDVMVSTVLEKGKVNVQMANQEEAVLQPNEQLVYNKMKGTWSKTPVDVYEKVAWKDGKLIFRNATLEEIFTRLSRHFNVEIVLNNRGKKELRYRATFRRETLPQILDYLAQSAAMKWRVEDPVMQEDDTLTKTKFIVDIY